MEIGLLIVLNLVSLTVAQGQKKVCFAPVACTVGDVTSSEWMEIDSKSQCPNKHSKEIVPTQATIPESRIKTLINESVAKFRSELTKLLSSKGDSDELKRLRNDVKEMNQTLNRNTASSDKELAKIKETLRLLNNSLQRKQACTQPGAMSYNNKCYWLILHNSANVSFTQAQKLCSQGGGIPGDILSQAHYDQVEAKCKEMVSSTSFFWLGMNINPSTKEVTLTDGSRAPFLKWYPGWPSSIASYTKMAMQVNQPPTPDGMFQRGPTSVFFGVLCQG